MAAACWLAEDPAMTIRVDHPSTCVKLGNGVAVPVLPEEVVVLWQEGDLPISVPEDLIGALPRHAVAGLPPGTRVLVHVQDAWLGGRVGG
jgi:hypothetical protein